MKRSAPVALALALFVGCSDADYLPAAGDRAYETGGLGNGAFLFLCDDTVTCDPRSENAERFPQMLAAGATFDLRFVPTGEQGEGRPLGSTYGGLTGEALGPFLGNGPAGYVALEPGYGTVIVRDHRGLVVDYLHLRVTRPDGFLLYAADAAPIKNPPAIESLMLARSVRRSLRAVPVRYGTPLAGWIPLQWQSSDPGVVAVESVIGGVVNIVTKGVGSARLTADGAAMRSTELRVQVLP